jgi:hypothetical protein
VDTARLSLWLLSSPNNQGVSFLRGIILGTSTRRATWLRTGTDSVAVIAFDSRGKHGDVEDRDRC